MQEELSLEMLQSIVVRESSIAVVLVDTHTLHQMEKSVKTNVHASCFKLTLVILHFCSADYSGHYIVLLDYDPRTDEFLCLNPSRSPGK